MIGTDLSIEAVTLARGHMGSFLTVNILSQLILKGDLSCTMLISTVGSSSIVQPHSSADMMETGRESMHASSKPACQCLNVKKLNPTCFAKPV